jgi:hypothetical protein
MGRHGIWRCASCDVLIKQCRCFNHTEVHKTIFCGKCSLTEGDNDMAESIPDSGATYTLAEIEKAWDQSIEWNKQQCDRMRGGIVTPRDTDQALNNLVTFIGHGLRHDLLEMIKPYFLGAITKQ